jgi:hypothetical protein
MYYRNALTNKGKMVVGIGIVGLYGLSRLYDLGKRAYWCVSPQAAAKAQTQCFEKCEKVYKNEGIYSAYSDYWPSFECRRTCDRIGKTVWIYQKPLSRGQRVYLDD